MRTEMAKRMSITSQEKEREKKAKSVKKSAGGLICINPDQWRNQKWQAVAITSRKKAGKVWDVYIVAERDYNTYVVHLEVSSGDGSVGSKFIGTAKTKWDRPSSRSP